MGKISKITLGNESYDINAAELGGIPASGYEKLDTKKGIAIMTTIPFNGIKPDKYVFEIVLDKSCAFNIDGMMEAGQELHAIIVNNSFVPITIAIPNGGLYKSNVDEITIEGQSFGEINVISNSGIGGYIRAI